MGGGLDPCRGRVGSGGSAEVGTATLVGGGGVVLAGGRELAGPKVVVTWAWVVVVRRAGCPATSTRRDSPPPATISVTRASREMVASA
jgi:hypothetical protein